jgi:hypothetical protein
MVGGGQGRREREAFARRAVRRVRHRNPNNKKKLVAMYILIPGIFLTSIICTITFLVKEQFVYALISTVVCFVSGTVGVKLFPREKL